MASIVTLDVEAIKAGSPVSPAILLLLPPVINMGLDTSPIDLNMLT
jgi:hypothetical protein